MSTTRRPRQARSDKAQPATTSFRRPGIERRTGVPRHSSRRGPGDHPPDALLTLGEAADKLRVSVRQVQRLRQVGALPATRIGSRAVVRRADLDDFIANLAGRR